MLYRTKGIVEVEGTFFWDHGLGQETQGTREEIKTFYLEATTFQKATTKAKKLFTHVHEVRQVQGEIVYEVATHNIGSAIRANCGAGNGAAALHDRIGIQHRYYAE